MVAVTADRRAQFDFVADFVCTLIVSKDGQFSKKLLTCKLRTVSAASEGDAAVVGTGTIDLTAYISRTAQKKVLRMKGSRNCVVFLKLRVLPVENAVKDAERQAALAAAAYVLV